MPKKDAWSTLQNLGIAYEFALGNMIEAMQAHRDRAPQILDDDLERARRWAGMVKMMIQPCSNRTPEGRRKLKLYSDIVYGVLNKAERALLNLEDL